MNKELLTAAENTAADLLETIAAFKTEQINQVPFKDSWTAGQVADHLIKAVSPQVLYGSVTTTTRNPDEKSPVLQDIFLNYNTKLKSPDFVLPDDGPQDKTFILEKLEKAWSGIEEAIRTLDLTATCTTFELPQLGTLTRLEWIKFMMYHTQRHTHQLKNIYSKVA